MGVIQMLVLYCRALRVSRCRSGVGGGVRAADLRRGLSASALGACRGGHRRTREQTRPMNRRRGDGVLGAGRSLVASRSPHDWMRGISPLVIHTVGDAWCRATSCLQPWTLRDAGARDGAAVYGLVLSPIGSGPLPCGTARVRRVRKRRGAPPAAADHGGSLRSSPRGASVLSGSTVRAGQAADRERRGDSVSERRGGRDGRAALARHRLNGSWPTARARRVRAAAALQTAPTRGLAGMIAARQAASAGKGDHLPAPQFGR